MKVSPTLYPSSLASCLMFGLICSLLCTLQLHAQEHNHDHSAEKTSAKALPVSPQTPEFKAATGEFREHLKKMREVLVRYNTDLTGASDKAMLTQWFELERAGIAIHQRMVDAALKEYLQDPAGKPALAEMLWGIVERNTEVDRFENLLPVVQALKANGFKHEKLPGTEAMIAFAMNEYDELKPILNELVAEGLASPMLVSIQSQLSTLKSLWEQELAAREKDRAGEPLPRVLIHTSKGDIELELFENNAPETVGSFISLVESGFYNGLTFHRVLEHFMAQTGCPVGDGTGGPGYTIYSEASKPGKRNFFRGTVGLAMSQNPDSGGSQFFICFLPVTHLNEGFTAFGRVTSGIEVLGSIVRINPDEKKDESKAPAMPDEILSIEVLSKRNHEYKPNKVNM